MQWAFYHYDKHDAALVAAANTTDPSTIDPIADPDRFEQALLAV